MLKLQFNVFQKKLEEERRNGHFPIVHCMIGVEGFTFVIKSRDKWEYYTTMLYEDIVSYSIQEGMDPMQAIDMFTINYCSNTIPIESVELIQISQQNVSESSEDSQDSLESITPGVDIKNTSLTKNVIDAGEDVIEEAKDYSGFLLNFFDKLEKDILKAINQIDPEDAGLNKTFGEFMRDFFNAVNSILFAKNVKKFIKIDLLAGLVSAESELNIDIGYTDAFDDALNVLASQQINGYTINGKLWPGIKGVTKEIQASVIQTVQEGINEKIGLEGIKKNIQDKFSNFSDWRSEMIARTETNRIINEGKILGYKETKIPGKKVWDSALDNRTSEICERLNRQTVGLDDDFIDPLTRKAYYSPPAHPNCRSVVRFQPY